MAKSRTVMTVRGGICGASQILVVLIFLNLDGGLMGIHFV